MSKIDRNATACVGRARLLGAQYIRSFRRHEDAAAWVSEIEALVRAGAAPNPNALRLDRAAAEYARAHVALWRDSTHQGQLADVRRRFGRMPCSTIVAADVAAWVGDLQIAGVDLAARDARLNLLSAILRHAQTKIKVQLPIGDPVRAWRSREAASRSVVPVSAPTPTPRPDVTLAGISKDLEDLDVLLRGGRPTDAASPSDRRARARPVPADVVDVPTRAVSPSPEPATALAVSGLVVAGQSIRRDADGLYCLNDLHRASGGSKRHQPSNFLATESAVALVNLLDRSIPGIQGIENVKSKQGLGTFVSKELVYAYAMWVSPRLHLEVIRAYDAMVARTALFAPVPAPAAPTHVATDVPADVLRELPALVASAVAQALTERPQLSAPSEPLLVDTAAASRMLGVSVSMLTHDRVGGRRVPFVRVGTRTMYSPQALREWVARSSVEPG